MLPLEVTKADIKTAKQMLNVMLAFELVDEDNLASAVRDNLLLIIAAAYKKLMIGDTSFADEGVYLKMMKHYCAEWKQWDKGSLQDQVISEEIKEFEASIELVRTILQSYI